MRLSPAIRATLVTLLLVPFLSGCSLLFVEGPAPGWETANAEDLPSMAISQPCTTSKILTTIDAVAAAVNGVYGILGIASSDTFGSGYQNSTEEALMYRAIGALIWSPIQAISALKGRNRVNDCRAFNVRLSEEQRRGAQAQATYNWLDEFSPAPDFRVAPQNLPAIIPPVRGFSPAFSGSISNSPDQ